MTQLASPGQGCSRNSQPPSLCPLPSPRPPASDPEYLGCPPPARDILYLPLYVHQGWTAEISLPHKGNSRSPKFQIPQPYLVPFFLTFDGLPGVGEGPPHPQRDNGGVRFPTTQAYPTDDPHPHPECVMTVYWGWNTQVVDNRERAAGNLGEGWTLGPTVTHVGVMVPFNPL